MTKKVIIVTALTVTVLLAGAVTYGRYGLRVEEAVAKTVTNPEAFKRTYTTELDELQKLIKRYSGDIFLNGEISYFEEKSGKFKVTERSIFTSIVTGKSGLFSIDSVVTLQDNGIGIMVDHREKLILVRESINEKQLTAGNLLPLEDLATYINDISIDNEGGWKVLTLRLKPEAPGSFRTCRIYYSPADYKLRKLIYSGTQQDFIEEAQADSANLEAYGEVMVEDEDGLDSGTGYLSKASALKVEMVYDMERKPYPNEVQASRYVIKKGDEYIPAAAYQHYMIHN